MAKPRAPPGHPTSASFRGDQLQIPLALEDDRDAFELRHIQTEDDQGLEHPLLPSLVGRHLQATRRSVSPHTSVKQPDHGSTGTWHKIRCVWMHHVSLKVPQNSKRDHFALERTFLAYIRTSLAIAMQGALIAQLFRIPQSPSSREYMRFYELGIPLSVTCNCVATMVALVGAYRFWDQQTAILRGKVHCRGWELNCVGLLLFAVAMDSQGMNTTNAFLTRTFKIIFVTLIISIAMIL
ncbi:uncharacterized protein N7529_002676 [Penicillium soppii]|uniref:uncharacterized protein n=1 Tax=Penicillium soppii TaxID=69789 RepID=UPI0025476602|nr:uncharacterized protein N7529_002676 [Penicillium soppii]KAJ5874246.1 hypothetical protein N7529_002676 [Penicillium soppii]